MSHHIRRFAALGAVTALALVPAAAAVAATGSHGTAAHSTTSSRPAKPVRHLQGTVTAIDAVAMTVTVTRHAAHHTTVDATFTVGSGTTFSRDDLPATLTDLVVGDHASAKVQTVDGVLTASRVNAESAEAPEPESSPSPSPSDD